MAFHPWYKNLVECEPGVQNLPNSIALVLANEWLLDGEPQLQNEWWLDVCNRQCPSKREPGAPKLIALVIAKWMVSQNRPKSIALAIAKRVCCWMEALLLAITTAHPKCEPGAPKPSQRYILGGWKNSLFAVTSAHPKCEPGESQNLPKGIALVIAECVVIGWNSPDPTTLQSLRPVFAKRELGLRSTSGPLWGPSGITNVFGAGLRIDAAGSIRSGQVGLRICFGSFRFWKNQAVLRGRAVSFRECNLHEFPECLVRLETGCGTLGPVEHEFYPVNIEERRVESVETAGLLFLFSVFMCTLTDAGLCSARASKQSN